MGPFLEGVSISVLLLGLLLGGVKKSGSSEYAKAHSDAGIQSSMQER